MRCRKTVKLMLIYEIILIKHYGDYLIDAELRKWLSAPNQRLTYLKSSVSNLMSCFQKPINPTKMVVMMSSNLDRPGELLLNPKSCDINFT